MQKPIDADFATLYGVLLGDGCLSDGKRHYIIHIAGALDDAAFYREIVLPIIHRKIGRRKQYKYRTYKDNHTWLEIRFCDKNLFYDLNEHGFPVGEKGQRIFIPDELKIHMQQVISGVFATDGSLVLTNNNGTIYPRLELKMKAKYLLEQILVYLRSLGLTAVLYTCNNKHNPDPIIYKIQSNGVANMAKFQEKIGFLNPKQQSRYDWMNEYLARRHSLARESVALIRRRSGVQIPLPTFNWYCNENTKELIAQLI